MSITLYINKLQHILSNHFMKAPDLAVEIPMRAINPTPY